MKYKVIIFDADETLFDFKKAEKEAFKNTILEFGMNYDESYHFETYKVINTAIWKELE
ncbi:MAG: noncanonical pyrimidine nucleotidase, YjjG family, partial [Terrisporobacter sp.]